MRMEMDINVYENENEIHIYIKSSVLSILIFNVKVNFLSMICDTKHEYKFTCL